MQGLPFKSTFGVTFGIVWFVFFGDSFPTVQTKDQNVLAVLNNVIRNVTGQPSSFSAPFHVHLLPSLSAGYHKSLRKTSGVTPCSVSADWLSQSDVFLFLLL